jgi:hypothetical protein
MVKIKLRIVIQPKYHQVKDLSIGRILTFPFRLRMESFLFEEYKTKIYDYFLYSETLIKRPSDTNGKS